MRWMRKDFAKRRENQRDCGKVVIVHGSKRRTCEAKPVCLFVVSESNESCAGARRTETCVAPRHAACRCVT